MPRIPGLRSPHARVGRLVSFGRTLDKIRLDARGELPEDYRANLGDAKPSFFDGRCCRFLGIGYPALRERTLAGGADEEILSWAESLGGPHSDEECVIWNRYMSKVGWRDDRSETVRERCTLYQLPDLPIETIFEVLDVDEGRPPGATRSWEQDPIKVIVVMGVSGCGKSTTAQGLAAALSWDFIEADELHPPSNIAKMSAGIPLDDQDRGPWLAAVRSSIDGILERGAKVVVSCSALKESYRRVLADDLAHTRFVHVDGDRQLIRSRIQQRSGHFMKDTLLDSQFATLERPLYALRVDASLSRQEQLERVLGTLHLGK